MKVTLERDEWYRFPVYSPSKSGAEDAIEVSDDLLDSWNKVLEAFDTIQAEFDRLARGMWEVE